MHKRVGLAPAIALDPKILFLTSRLLDSTPLSFLAIEIFKSLKRSRFIKELLTRG